MCRLWRQRQKKRDAAAERRMVTKYLQHEKEELSAQLEMRKETVENEYKRKAREIIKAELMRTDKEEKESTFYVNFPEKNGIGEKLSFQAANKESWADVRLALGNGKKRKPVAEFKELPADKVRLEVNMRRVRVARLRHGHEVLVYPNTSAYKGHVG